MPRPGRHRDAPRVGQAGGVRLPALLLTAAVTLSGCGGTTSTGACGRAVHEDLDPLSAVHPLGDADVEYLTSPPTSGPHLAISGPTGAVDGPLTEVVQVTVLARGAVLVQYRSPTDATALAALSVDRDVVIAPAPDLDDPVVATAWTVKLRCDAVDVDRLVAFAETHAGREHH